MIVSIIDPNKTFPSKYLIIIMVTIAEASIFAKLLPTKIAESNWSGFFNNSKERFALFFDFFDRFFNLILFAAIIPVSEPEKNPLSINKKIKTINKIKREGSSSIINL